MSDNEAVPLSAELPIAIDKAIMRIGKTNGTRVQFSNDSATAAAQELFVARAAKKSAEVREKAAREELLKHLTVPDVKGTHPLIVNERVVVTGVVKTKSATLDTAALITNMVKEFSCTMEAAAALIERSRKDNGGTQTELQVTIR